MLRFSAAALLALVLFGLIFALLPAASSVRGSGVKLSGVKLRLYPAQDPKAEWRFAAGEISVDPEKGETALDQLGQGERWAQDAAGDLQKDMTIKATNLVIDGQDNLHAKQAELYTLADCSTFTLSSTGNKEVVINQQGGYSAPAGELNSPITKGRFINITANFDFSNFQAEQPKSRQDEGLHTYPSTRCFNGKVEPR
ncbi:hypothetical protein FNU79_06905 [Deinococcus detaillensis]|uniref:LPS export ABC transporter periplasmic protein LptC n=1 Tax=Deinococcus detaillensis TaxID=2592048 RepID=A0A553V1Q8_9DEIO|nr:hypothetical protein [Deinococcus detaillensis]TSA86385.1 hypothetical protein FNU79_06905 [Deinococcus detaillensis]